MMKALLLFFIPAISYAECSKVDVKIIFDKKEQITKETLCSIKSPDKTLFYVSKSCENKQCEILKRPKKEIEVKNYYGTQGSPGFKLCSELGGVPQIFEFKKAKENWESTERCFFGREDFVEISYLTQEWKYLIKTLTK